MAANGTVTQLNLVLTEKEAARFLAISVSSLRKARMNGARANHLPPPPFVRLGRRVVYRVEDLNAYLEQHRVDAAEGGHAEA